MAFTGYVFDNAAAISPYLEEPRTGPTSQFCAELAKNLNCYVLAGYPERLSPEELKSAQSPIENTDSSQPQPEIVGANSAVMYGPGGEWVGGYRKTNLFETDMTWAKPGTGFATFHLPPPLQTLSLGICMDLNPADGATWELETGPYEIAHHCMENKSRLLILLNAWLLSSTYDPTDEHDWGTLQYWATRLRPLWIGDERGSPDPATDNNGEDADINSDKEETIVVVCNRSGSENGKNFAGTSAIYSMVKGSGRPKLLDMMEKDEEGIKVWNITI